MPQAPLGENKQSPSSFVTNPESKLALEHLNSDDGDDGCSLTVNSAMEILW